jgi:hypothetical protein
MLRGVILAIAEAAFFVHDSLNAASDRLRLGSHEMPHVAVLGLDHIDHLYPVQPPCVMTLTARGRIERRPVEGDIEMLSPAPGLDDGRMELQNVRVCVVESFGHVCIPNRAAGFQAMLFFKVPIPSTRTSMVSPDFIGAIPDGVPVEIRSPGLRVITDEM